MHHEDGGSAAVKKYSSSASSCSVLLVSAWPCHGDRMRAAGHVSRLWDPVEKIAPSGPDRRKCTITCCASRAGQGQAQTFGNGGGQSEPDICAWLCMPSLRVLHVLHAYTDSAHLSLVGCQPPWRPRLSTHRNCASLCTKPKRECRGMLDAACCSSTLAFCGSRPHPLSPPCRLFDGARHGQAIPARQEEAFAHHRPRPTLLQRLGNSHEREPSCNNT